MKSKNYKFKDSKLKIKLPDKDGYFGKFGGVFVPEILFSALQELCTEYSKLKNENGFKKELNFYLNSFAGRPTSLYYAERLSQLCNGAKVYLKREDLCHTGAHKINNAIGQVLIARKMGKKRIIAETGAGQHGVATATVSAMFGLKCDIYMGEEDIERQKLNVFRMQILGARVIPVTSGSRTLKDAVNETMRDWVTNIKDTHYIIGSVVGPHPYPVIVRDFQAVIGNEARKQILKIENKLPDYIIACVGGGSNAAGIFYPFYNDKSVKLIGIEGGGLGLNTKAHAATLTSGSIGVLHGALSYLLQDKYGQIQSTHSISAGLDYPGVGPEHSYYKDSGRAVYTAVKDIEVLNAFQKLSELEGIIPALESAHAIAYLLKNAKKFKKNEIIILNLSGRGDKDINTVLSEIEKGK